VLGVPLAEYRRRLPVLDSVAMTTLRVPVGRPTEPVAVLAYNAPLCQLDGEHGIG
jgi:probable phosphoglycerate mutase